MVDVRELQQQFTHCMPLFIALGDEVRLTIIETLSTSGLVNSKGLDVTESLNSSKKHAFLGMNVKEITEKTNLSRPAISHHLKILKDAGLVSVRRDGTSNFYYLTIESGTRMLLELGTQLQLILTGSTTKECTEQQAI